MWKPGVESKSFQRCTFFGPKLYTNTCNDKKIKKNPSSLFLIILKNKSTSTPLPGGSYLDAQLLSSCKHWGAVENQATATERCHNCLLCCPMRPFTVPIPPASTSALWSYETHQQTNTCEKWEEGWRRLVPHQVHCSPMNYLCW